MSADLLTCPTCQQPVSRKVEFCPSCLNEIRRGAATGPAAEVRTWDAPPVEEPSEPADASLQLIAAPLAMAAAGLVDQLLLVLTVIVFGGLGVGAGVPLFNAPLRGDYWWVTALCTSLAGGAAWLGIRVRSQLIEEEDADVRKRTTKIVDAGAEGGVSHRDHAMPNRHIVIAAVMMFAIGLGVGAFVHVRQ